MSTAHTQEVADTLEREKGKVKEGSRDGTLGYTNISGREVGRKAGKDDV